MVIATMGYMFSDEQVVELFKAKRLSVLHFLLRVTMKPEPKVNYKAAVFAMIALNRCFEIIRHPLELEAMIDEIDDEPLAGNEKLSAQFDM